MVHVAQVGYATPTSEGNALYTVFSQSMGEDDHVVYDDVTRRLTFFTYDEEVWHADGVDIHKLCSDWEKEYAR